MKKIAIVLWCAIFMATSLSFAKTVEISGDSEYTSEDVTVQTTTDAAYYRYVNARYGCMLDIPSTSDSAWETNMGDGASFAVTADKAKFLVYSNNNIMKMGIKELRNIDMVNSGVATFILQQSGPDWYVLSWKNKDKIYYKKLYMNKNQDRYSSFQVSYPLNKADTYKPVVEHMEKTFNPGWSIEK